MPTWIDFRVEERVSDTDDEWIRLCEAVIYRNKLDLPDGQRPMLLEGRGRAWAVSREDLSEEGEAALSAKLAREADELIKAARVARALRTAEAVEVKPGPRTVKDPILGSVVQIPDTTFWMGSPDGEGADAEHPRHQVTLSAYAIGITVVTREQWARVMNEPAPRQPRRPKVGVMWVDALRFCNDASARAGLRPCYQERGETWIWDRGADGYRLPTEAEWECAARADTETRWSTGDDERALAAAAWYGKEWTPEAGPPVAQKAANPWGLYDMHGNVSEWCWDAYDAGAYARAAPRDPGDNVAADICYRVIRGGAFNETAGVTRSANRECSYAWGLNWTLGFRCVRSSLPTGSVTTKTADSDSR